MNRKQTYGHIAHDIAAVLGVTFASDAQLQAVIDHVRKAGQLGALSVVDLMRVAPSYWRADAGMQPLPTDEQRAFATLVLDGLVKQATADYGGGE